MKKRIFNALFLGISVFYLTGCVKFNASMDIKKDKSMDLDIIYAVDSTIFNEEVFTSEEKTDLVNKGFRVSDYQDGNMSGITISKNIKNIDNVSTTKETNYSLSNITNENTDNYIFTIKKGFFKNTYKAQLDFNAKDNNLTEEKEETQNLEEETIEDWTIDEENNIDFSQLTNNIANMDLSFNVNLPYSAKNSNATKTNNNNKKLSWTLSSNEEQTIEFEFELYNITNIYIVIAIALIIVIIIIALIIKKKNKKETIKIIPSTDTTPVDPLSSLTSTNEKIETIIPDLDQAEIIEPINTNTEQKIEIVESDIIEELDINMLQQPNTNQTSDIFGNSTNENNK